MRFTLDTHTHTIASGHAYNTIDEMAVYAAGHGVTHLAITDHAPKMPGSAGVLYFSNMGIIPRKKYGVNIYMGCEVNIMDYDGRLDLSEYGLEAPSNTITLTTGDGTTTLLIGNKNDMLSQYYVKTDQSDSIYLAGSAVYITYQKGIADLTAAESTTEIAE